MRPLSKNLKKARAVKGWSQQRAAQKIGIKQKRYAKYEEDRAEPNTELLKIILEYFGIREEDMYPFVYNENFWTEK
jgi:transcriptional regulator with XRE-family HTH domain